MYVLCDGLGFANFWATKHATMSRWKETSRIMFCFNILQPSFQNMATLDGVLDFVLIHLQLVSVNVNKWVGKPIKCVNKIMS
jgi:hypothetical protein